MQRPTFFFSGSYFLGKDFSKVFKDITFDNGNEFAYWKDMETDPKTGKRRTSIFFTHPYCSYERGSNENCNGLIRRFIKKGTDVNKIDRNVSIKINKAINRKRRKPDPDADYVGDDEDYGYSEEFEDDDDVNFASDEDDNEQI